MNDDDRYTRITLRIPRDLHQRLGEVAEKTSKSLNAEIIGRLQSSVDESGSAELESLRKDLEIALLSAQRERLSCLSVKLFAAHLTTLVDPALLAKDPSLEAAALALRKGERSLVLEMAENTLVGMTHIPRFQDMIEKDGLQLVPDSEPETWSKAPSVARSLATMVMRNFGHEDETFLQELFSRDSLVQALKTRAKLSEKKSSEKPDS